MEALLSLLPQLHYFHIVYGPVTAQWKAGSKGPGNSPSPSRRSTAAAPTDLDDGIQGLAVVGEMAFRFAFYDPSTGSNA